jgi:dethiobiotin synthetase
LVRNTPGADRCRKILAAFQTLQRRVDHVIVEGVGGWLVPIRSDYFVSDLAAAMKLPVLVVAQNRLGCLNQAALTVRVAAYELRCTGLVLNRAEMASDIAALTNADILKRILTVPLLAGLGENLTELPVDWRLMLDSTKEH